MASYLTIVNHRRQMLILNFVMNQTKKGRYPGKTCHSYRQQDAA